MSERYQLVDMAETGPAAVRTAFANQVAYCRANDARVTARIVAALATLLDKPATEFARPLPTPPAQPFSPIWASAPAPTMPAPPRWAI